LDLMEKMDRKKNLKLNWMSLETSLKMKLKWKINLMTVKRLK